MKRKLGKFETASAITGENFAWNIVAVIIIEGKLSPQDLRSALDIAQKRHPMLNVRIVRQKKGYEFQEI